MADFKQIREQLDESRRAQAVQYKNFLESREQLKKITRQREAAERKINDNSDDHQEELNGLKEEERRATDIFNRSKAAVKKIRVISMKLSNLLPIRKKPSATWMMLFRFYCFPYG
jgi:septation ring formation regulator EzrA